MRGMDAVKWALQAIYPRRCPVCHDIVMPAGHLICPSCKGKMRLAKEPRCKKCSKPLEKEETEYCADCAGRSHAFEEAAGIFLYDKIMRESLMKCKYGGRREYLDYYGQAMARYGWKYLKRWRPQAFAPVPLHKARQRRRGFNQSAVLARELAGSLNVPVYEHMLEKPRKTRPQKELEARQRRTNLKGAFIIGRDFQPFETVVLVDDVYTTGSTADEAARCLKEAGVGTVYVMTLCIGNGF